jgi:hypothetical protein
MASANSALRLPTVPQSVTETVAVAELPALLSALHARTCDRIDCPALHGGAKHPLAMIILFAFNELNLASAVIILGEMYSTTLSDFFVRLLASARSS